MAQDPRDGYGSDDDYAAFLAEEGDAIWDNDYEYDPFYDSSPPPFRHPLDELIFMDAHSESFKSDSAPKAFLDLDSDHKEREEPRKIENGTLHHATSRVKLATDIEQTPDLPHNHSQTRDAHLDVLTEEDIERSLSPVGAVRLSRALPSDYDFGLGNGYDLKDEDSEFRPGADPVLVSVDLSDIRESMLKPDVRPFQMDEKEAELAAMLIQNELFLQDLAEMDDMPERPGGLELRPIGYDDMNFRLSNARIKIPDGFFDDSKNDG